MSKESPNVKLKRPTDFLILECLSEGGRNVASNIALEIDKNRDYVNTRLPVLEDYGLIEKIGPSERSGLYEITNVGETVLRFKDKYNSDDVDFDELIEEEIKKLDDSEREAPA